MERPAIHGQTRRMNINPPSSWQGFKNHFLEVMSEWIGVRMEQEREEGKMDLYLLWNLSAVTPLALLYLKGDPPLYLPQALVGVTSRRLVIQENVFCVPDPIPLPFPSECKPSPNKQANK